MLLNACLAVALLGALFLLGRGARSWAWHPTGLETFLDGPYAPVALGFLTAVVVRCVWGSFGEPGVIHDERAYLLQAEIFARGHWTAPSPPLPRFFEQMHVFVEPAVFAKYPPVHALMLVPGVWLGLPGLMPVLLGGIAGALTFWLARRLSNVWTALVTWILWTTAPATLLWAASYLSESTSTVLWLAAASAAVLWLESGRQVYLVGVAAALSFSFGTRPLTTVAFAAPLGFVIVRRLIQAGTWRTAVIPLLTGVLFLALGPLWNQRTLGDWKLDPYSVYSRTYFPFDKPGFGVDTSPPLKPLPSEFLGMDAWSRAVHEDYVPSRVPLAFAQRILALLSAYAVGWRVVIGALLIASLPRARGTARFAIVCSVSLLIAYLAFAHPPAWIVYYVELLPALYFLAAAHLVRLLGGTTARGPDVSVSESRRIARSSALAAALLVPLCVYDVARTRAAIDIRNAFHRQALLATSGAPPNSILFVRYPPGHDPHLAVTRNEADLASARSWIVYDRGTDNARLIAVAPSRRPYLLDVATFRLEALSPRD